MPNKKRAKRAGKAKYEWHKDWYFSTDPAGDDPSTYNCRRCGAEQFDPPTAPHKCPPPAPPPSARLRAAYADDPTALRAEHGRDVTRTRGGKAEPSAYRENDLRKLVVGPTRIRYEEYDPATHAVVSLADVEKVRKLYPPGSMGFHSGVGDALRTLGLNGDRK